MIVSKHNFRTGREDSTRVAYKRDGKEGRN